MSLSEESTEQEAGQVLTSAFPHAAAGLSRYAELLRAEGTEWGLLGPREGVRVWRRHIGNSLALCPIISEGLDVADVGSGAGLPGIPLALARPDLRVTLIEPLLRRSGFLTMAVQELGVTDRVEVMRSRAEETQEHFDAIVCRAVAPLQRLIKWTTPLIRGGGCLIALKGDNAEREIRDAAKDLTRQGLAAEIITLRAAQGIEGTRAVRIAAD